MYSVKGQDLITHRTVKLTDAILGTTLDIPTPDGKDLSLKVPPGTRPGTKMRLGGHGLPTMKGNKRGDLYVQIQVEIPKKLTDDQKRLVEELAAAGL
jgi:curved DNA-binding protein